MKTTTFICGCGHAATLLVASMFAHPAVCVPPQETETLLDNTAPRERRSSLLTEATHSGKVHWVEKTPLHIHRLGLIRREDLIEQPAVELKRLCDFAGMT